MVHNILGENNGIKIKQNIENNKIKK